VGAALLLNPNPKGIPHEAQGCEETSYPGIGRVIDDNPERVGPSQRERNQATTPLGL